jgi:hypothetical protein
VGKKIDLLELMVRILIFRTDRIGDLILTCPTIITLKKHFKNSEITIVTSKKNFSYANNLNIFDKILQFPETLIGKIKFITSLLKKKYNYVFIFDGKERSILSSLLLKSDFKVALTQNKKFYYKFSKINFFLDNDKTNLKEIFQNSLNFCNINVLISNYDFLNNKINNGFSLNVPILNYIHIHLDEKWFNNLYINSYTKINPSYNSFIDFLNTINKNEDILITTGLINFDLLDNLRIKYLTKKSEKIYYKKNINKSLYFIFKPTFSDIESLLRNAKVLISCHGAITHASNSFSVKKIDIIEQNKENFYKRFNSYLKDYHSIYRNDFNLLNANILKLL